MNPDDAVAVWQNALRLPNPTRHTWHKGLIATQSKVLPLSGQRAPWAGRGMLLKAHTAKRKGLLSTLLQHFNAHGWALVDHHDAVGIAQVHDLLGVGVVAGAEGVCPQPAQQVEVLHNQGPVQPFATDLGEGERPCSPSHCFCHVSQAPLLTPTAPPALGAISSRPHASPCGVCLHEGHCRCPPCPARLLLPSPSRVLSLRRAGQGGKSAPQGSRSCRRPEVSGEGGNGASSAAVAPSRGRAALRSPAAPTAPPDVIPALPPRGTAACDWKPRPGPGLASLPAHPGPAPASGVTAMAGVRMVSSNPRPGAGCEDTAPVSSEGRRKRPPPQQHDARCPWRALTSASSCLFTPWK